MSSTTKFYWESMIPLDDLVVSGDVKLGRGNVISKIDIRENPGPYPIYSSSAKNDGKMGEYGSYMFDDEMISWSVDGGGYFFHRPKHKFSVTNVSGYMCLNQDWDYKFIAYSLQFQHGYFSFDYQAKAHPSVIREFYFFPKIPVAEQQKIATILSSVDDVIEKTRAQIDKLKDLKVATIQELFTKGAGHTEFKNSDVGAIPANWKVVSLGDITKSSAFGPRFSSDYYSDSGNIGCIRTTDIDDDWCINYRTVPLADLIFDEFEGHLLIDGDLLVTRSGTCGLVDVFQAQALPMVAAAFIIRFRLFDTVNPWFVKYLMMSPTMQENVQLLASGGVQKNLSGTSLKTLQFAMPFRSEQDQIVTVINSINKKITAVHNKLDSYKIVKQALMQDLLTGKVRVNLTDKESAAV